MKIVGIVGGIASGKSVVSALLHELGGIVLDADRVAHDVLQLQDVQQELLARWGPKIVDHQGNIDRKQVSQQIFTMSAEPAVCNQTEQERQFLEQLLHPRIRKQFEQEIHKLKNQGESLVILDAPLLLEAGWGAICDEILFVGCPLHIRLQRALQRGWTKQQFLARERAQWPIDKKRDASTFQIDNSVGPPDLLVKILQDWLEGRYA